jgi:hypothetical protein
MKKFLYVLLVLAMLPVALLVIITPMDSQKQYIFGLLSIGVLFLMGLAKNAACRSLWWSCRFYYRRAICISA